MSQTLPPSISERTETSSIRPTLTLGNDDSNATPNFQQSTSVTTVERSIQKIPNFIIWSVFNLLLVPLGIVCCYFSYIVNKYKAQNRYAIAKRWSKRTFVINIITTLLMSGLIVTIVMLHYDHDKRTSHNNGTEPTYIPWQPGR
ncbi:unnamed protein product [Rotaria sordida]|uniref:Uncharacterized protein n=1 Tax=Rotaria sordida TaxID=392033 RepID=A0A814LRV3_9BILA|nr:unnamed protein product [Rotaria sordida]CAF1206570.1 unnamed protein product [Rotaria sordida]CAF1481288.1 unnamed protein product [Rotaria sordida]CAF3664954.1 unnamed protein product [Rotaria sordida]